MALSRYIIAAFLTLTSCTTEIKTDNAQAEIDRRILEASQKIQSAQADLYQVGVLNQATSKQPISIVNDQQLATSQQNDSVHQASPKEQTSESSPIVQPVKTTEANNETTPAKTMPTWTLAAGHTVYQELKKWADQAGWQVIWNLNKDWTVPAHTSYSGEFQQAAAEVITTLATNGALIRAQFFKRNRTMVVTGRGAA